MSVIDKLLKSIRGVGKGNPITYMQLSAIIRALWSETHDNNVIENIAQVAHGFTVGQTVRQNGEGAWELAQADAFGVMAIVCRVVTADIFWIRTGGLLPGEYTIAAKYFQSIVTSGALMMQTDPEVWEAGQYWQFIGTGSDKGLLIEIAEPTIISEIAIGEVKEVDLIGVVDGENKNYSTPVAYQPGSISVFLNGQKLNKDDYTETSDTTVTLVDAPKNTMFTDVVSAIITLK